MSFDGNKKLSDIGFASSPVSTVVDTSAADFISVIGRGVSSLLKEKPKDNTALLNRFEDTLLNAEQTVRLSRDALSVVGDKQEGDIVFSPSQKAVLNRASSLSDRLNVLEEQEVSASAISLQRLADFRMLKAESPELAPELRKFFKQQTGSSPLETLQQVEQSRAEAEKESKQAVTDFANKVAAANGIDVTLSTEEKLRQYQPFQAALRVTQENNIQVEALQSRLDLDKTQRISVERDLMIGSISGRTVQNRMLIAEELSNFNFATATGDEKVALIDKLNNEKDTFRATLADTYPATFTEAEGHHKHVFDMYDRALEVVNGKRDSESTARSLKFTQDAAMLGLWEMPEMAPFLTQMQFMKNLPNSFISAQTRNSYQASITTPLAAIARGVADPQANPGVSVLEQGRGETKVNYFKEIAGTLTTNMTDPKHRQAIGNSLTATTNVFRTSPNKVDASSYLTMLEVVANPDSLKMLSTQVGVADNFAAGLPRFEKAAQAQMTTDLGASISVGVSVDPVSYNLSLPAGPSADSFTTRPSASSQPFLYELVTVSHSAVDGRLIFKAKSSVANENNVQRAVRALNLRYSNAIGQLVRGHAHTVQGNTDYDAAWNAWVSGNGFNSGDTTVIPTEPEVTE